eukprot:COSAG01_NODE_38357_length_490_cov_3.580563_1_plen_101_part_01
MSCIVVQPSDDAAAALRGSCSAAPLRGGLEYYCGRLSVCRAQLTELRGAPLGRPPAGDAIPQAGAFGERGSKSSALWVTGTKSSALFLMGTKSSALLVLCT